MLIDFLVIFYEMTDKKGFARIWDVSLEEKKQVFKMKHMLLQ